MEDKRQATALFRYSLTRELADPELSPRQRGALITALTENDHAFLDGRRIQVSAPPPFCNIGTSVRSVSAVAPPAGFLAAMRPPQEVLIDFLLKALRQPRL